MNLSKSQQWKMGAGMAVVLVVLLPLWGAMREPGLTGWNVFLTLFLIGLAVCVFFGQRYLLQHIDEVGEARFDTRNKSDKNG